MYPFWASLAGLLLLALFQPTRSWDCISVLTGALRAGGLENQRFARKSFMLKGANTNEVSLQGIHASVGRRLHQDEGSGQVFRDSFRVLWPGWSVFQGIFPVHALACASIARASTQRDPQQQIRRPGYRWYVCTNSCAWKPGYRWYVWNQGIDDMCLMHAWYVRMSLLVCIHCHTTWLANLVSHK